MPTVGFGDSSEPKVLLSELGGYNATNGSYGALGHRIAAAFRLQFEDVMQARGLHGAVGILLWARLLKVFTVDAEFGPLVLTFLAMVRDVARFALLQLVFSAGFAAALLCAARPYPDRRLRCNGGTALGETYDSDSECAAACEGQCQTQLWRGLSKSFSEAYFQIYGEHFLGAPPPFSPLSFRLLAHFAFTNRSPSRSHSSQSLLHSRSFQIFPSTFLFILSMCSASLCLCL